MKISKTGASRIRMSYSDRVFYIVNFIIALSATLLVLYPLVYIYSASVSTGSSVISGRMWLYPVDWSFYAYDVILKYKYLWIGYGNTVFYTVFGTIINIIMTMACAYPLARKNLHGRGLIMAVFTFTMVFSGGMIPSYLLMKNLNILSTIWVMLLPGAMSVYNMIITRTFIQSTIPDELLEAARIDGCSDFKFLFRIVIPLSTTILAVNGILYASSHWNSYFNAFLYLSKRELYPLQIFLRQILVDSNFTADMLDPETVDQMANIKEILRYALIVVSTLPMIAMYPFFQKYFSKGIMIGSLKG